ncbi:MAG: hypothetical protein Q4G25_13450 [Paracoccus sp. (in: a-proteobacteria)]|nr:hypothetical protein [Paracoccus sp. (in: a-proteobacteria)]
MLKTECSRNCWLAAGVAGLLVWIFNGTFFGGLALGFVTFVLLGGFLVWLVCEGRGGQAESAEVLGAHAAATPAAEESAILNRAEQAVADAGSAFASRAAAALDKGRDALREYRAGEKSGDGEAVLPEMAPRPLPAAQQARALAGESGDTAQTAMPAAEDTGARLEEAGDSVKGAMGALAARGKATQSGAAAVTAARATEIADVPAAVHFVSAPAGPEEVLPTADLPDEAQPAKARKAAKKSAKKGAAKGAKKDKPAKAGKAASAEPAKKAAKSEKPAKAEKVEKAEKLATAEKAGMSEKARKSARSEKPAKASAGKKAKAAAAAAPDDLKQIKGVGPMLEGLLNDHGVTRFEQIAGWDDAEIDRHAELIGRMGGRIRSDDWVAQAQILARGGETEFSRRVDKDEVYG